MKVVYRKGRENNGNLKLSLVYIPGIPLEILKVTLLSVKTEAIGS